jgi:hypothetical protein
VVEVLNLQVHKELKVVKDFRVQIVLRVHRVHKELQEQQVLKELKVLLRIKD